MGTAVRPAKTSPGPWDAFADVDAFVDEVLAELEAMAKDGSRPMRAGPKPPLVGATLRKAIMAIWCVGFCGMQWRAIGQLCEIPFGTLYGRHRQVVGCLPTRGAAGRAASDDTPNYAAMATPV